MTYEYKAELVGPPHDGDTARVKLDLGLRTYRELNIRLYGINAPELATPGGPPARDHLIELLGTGPLIVRTIRDRADKYGERWLGKIWRESDGTWGPDNEFVTSAQSVNQRMLDDGFAVVYLP